MIDEAKRGGGAVRVPGATATPVHAGIWNHAFATLTRSRTAISAFFHSILASRTHAQRVPSGQVWPMPLPFPEMHRRGGRRLQVDTDRKLGINYIVLVLSWMSCEEKLVDVSTIGLGCKLNKAQWQVVRSLTSLVDSWNAQGRVTAEDMGRAASKVENIESLLRQLEEASLLPAKDLRSYLGRSMPGPQSMYGAAQDPGDVVGTMDARCEHVAKDIEASRLKFHHIPTFDPRPYLDNRNRAHYERPQDAVSYVDPETLPKVKVRASPVARMQFLEKLDSGQRLQLIPQRLVEEGFENGAFAIPKDQEKDRLVLDARRPNAREESEKRWVYTMGSASQLNFVYLEEEDVMLIHAEDLRDFYHAFVVGENRVLRNCFKMKVKPYEVEHLSCFTPELAKEDWLTPALSTMAMGDANAVAFGQVAHLSLILRTQQFSLDDFIGLKMRPSRRSIRSGLMIDDFIVFEEMNLEEWKRITAAGEKTAGSLKVQRIREAYEEAGLPRHPTKAVEQSTEGEFWGYQLDGIAGRARPNLKRLVPLAGIILRTVRAMHASVGLLEILAGALTSVFQARRRFMSALNHIYAAQRGRERWEVVQLSRSLRAELLACVALMVLSVIDMRLKPSSILVCSDASSRAEAAVSAEVGPNRTRELQRHGLQKGLWSRLLSPALALRREKGLIEDAAEELPDLSYEMHPLWETIAQSVPFRQFGRIRRVRGKRHINIGEVSAALSAERLQGLQEPNTYYVHLQDSQVALACLVKGRSASPALNSLLRQSIPYHVSSNNRAHYGFLRSKFNPSDDPTRGVPVRAPTCAAPEWWEELSRREFANFDKFLERGRVHPSQIAELPDPSELLPDEPIDLRKSAEVKADRGRARRAGNDKKTGRGEETFKIGAEDADQRKLSLDSHKAGIAAGADEHGGSKFAEDAESRGRGSTEAGDSRGCETAEDVGNRGRGTAEAVSCRGCATTEKAECNKSRTREASADTTQSELNHVTETRSKCKIKEAEETAAEVGGDRRTGRSWQEEIKEKFRPDQCLFDKRKFKSLDDAMASGPGLLDLFSGARGFAREFVKKGCPWAICFDLKHHESEDLLNGAVQRTLRRLLSSGAFLAMVASPVCASFSSAITPPWRTPMYPGGRPDLTEAQQFKIDLGQRQLKFVLQLVDIAIRHSIIFWIENPDGSWFWRQEGDLSWDSAIKLSNGTLQDFRVDQCRYGTSWRKRTRFRTNGHLGRQRVLCRCVVPHVLLRGRCPKRKMLFTKLAESYPRALCSTLATAMAIDVGLIPGRRKLDANACARCNAGRIGEATNPGPRKAAHKMRAPLDSFQLLEPQTIAMRARFWADFSDWVHRTFGEGSVELFLHVPAVFVKVLEAYGRVQYEAGSPLHYYRQLVAHIQREHLTCKPYITSAWQLISQWELAEPIQHRPPVPEPIVRAIAALSILWGWKRFAGAVLLTFYGIARVGEVLRSLRADLLTAQDLLADEPTIYLKIRNPKTRNRGATTQYITCSDPSICRFLSETFGPLLQVEKLFPYTPASFRRRWDLALSALGIPTFHRLTPGGLRGGGCVAAHRRGLPIADLMWRMRPAHAKTLGHYLQEVTAASILPALSDSSREKIAILQDTMRFLIEPCLSAQPA